VATYRFSAKLISRSSGRCAPAAAAYRAGERIVDTRTAEVFDYRRRSDVLDREILAPQGAADWVLDRSDLWNTAELTERRKDAQVAREIQVSLPHELSLDANRALLHAFVTEQFVARGMVADVAIHAAHRQSDERNVHAHVLLTTRNLTAEGFGAKERAWNDRALLEGWRSEWESHVNRALEKANVDERVDHRSYVARGIDLEAEPKQGPVATKMERQGRRSRAGDDRRATKARNAERTRLSQEQRRLEQDIQEGWQRRENERQQRSEREGSNDHARHGCNESQKPTHEEERSGFAHPDAPSWQRRREEVLSETYTRDMSGTALARFWRIHRIDDGLAFENARGRFVDHGSLITSQNGNELELCGMLELATVKGWTEVQLTGSDDFKWRAMAAALKRGFTIHAEGRDAQVLRDVESSLQRDANATPHSTKDRTGSYAHERDDFEQDLER